MAKNFQKIEIEVKAKEKHLIKNSFYKLILFI